MRAKDALGRYGEDMAARFLAEAGMSVLERNWRCSEGEIDIVARDGPALVVCEVKTRRDDRFGGPLEAVTWAKGARLRRLAARWLADQQQSNRYLAAWQIRIDLVAVWAPRSGPVRIEHRRGVL